MTTFNRYLSEAERQLELSAAVQDAKIDQYRECARIIAEVYMMPGNFCISIDGAEMTVNMVKSVYMQLTFEHIQYVVEKFNKITYEIRSKKAFLRTMLYNAVFEMESSIANEVAVQEG